MIRIGMRLEGIDTHLVVALHALLEEKSVTLAARRVGLTQPSMSHALGKLRDHFGDPLLVRVGRSLALTERARSLLTPAAVAIASLDRVFGSAPRFDPKHAVRTFRIATSDNLALFVLPRLAALLAREAPCIDVRCTNIAADWSNALRRGEIDLKLGRAEAATDALRTKILIRDSLVCVVRRGHLATRSRLTAAKYAAFDHLLVAPRGGDTGMLDRALAARGLQRRIALTVPHFLVAPFIVASSDLVLTIPTRVASTFAPLLNLAILQCPVRIASHGLAQTWSATTDDDDGHQWLRRTVERVARRGEVRTPAPRG